MRLKHFLSVFLTLLTLSVGQMWGAVNDVVASVNPTADLGAGQNYNPASNDDWAVNVTNNSAFGTNAKSSNNDKLKLSNNSSVSTRNTAIATALAAYTKAEFTVNTQYVAALIGLTELSNVGKVGVTYGGTNGGNPDDMWVLYSTNSGSTYSVAGHTSSVSSGTNITFTSTISSAQYAVVFKKSAAFGIKNTPTITFYEGATATSYTITAQSSNNTYGTVSLDGSVITATPAANCRIASTAYNVTSGTATVARGTGENINKFTVTPSSNCTVRINFEQIPTHKISFNTGGLVVIDDATGIKEGDTYNITQTPAASLTDNCEYGTFVGWTTASSIANTSVCPNLVSSVNMSTSDVTLHAVYSKTTGGGGAAVGTTMFSENWTEATNNDQPSLPTANGSSVYGNASVSYDWYTPSGGSKSQTYNTGGPNSNDNILVSKNSGYWKASGIPTGGATTLTLSYAYSGSSSSFSISSSTTDVSVSGNTITISKPNDVTSFELTFTNSGSGNGRLDDISVVVATTSNAGITTYSLEPNCCQPLASINGSFFWTTAFCPAWPAKHRS